MVNKPLILREKEIGYVETHDLLALRPAVPPPQITADFYGGHGQSPEQRIQERPRIFVCGLFFLPGGQV